jgi:hypothetical protein
MEAAVSIALGGITVRTETDSPDIQFFLIPDDAPVYRRRFLKDAEFHKTPEFVDHPKALADAGHMYARYNSLIYIISILSSFLCR